MTTTTTTTTLTLSYGKKTLRWLPASKTLIVTDDIKSVCYSYLFCGFFIADLENLEDLVWYLSLSDEILNVGINGSDWSNGCSGGGESGVHSFNLLELRVILRGSLGSTGVAIVCIASLLLASETRSFPHTACSFRRGEFSKLDKVHIHGIRVSGGARGGIRREGRGGQTMSLFECKDAFLLWVKVYCFVNPTLKGGGNFFHGVDHKSNLKVWSSHKSPPNFCSVPCLGLGNKILELGDI